MLIKKIKHVTRIINVDFKKITNKSSTFTLNQSLSSGKA